MIDQNITYNYYDYIVVGAGLFGAAFAHTANALGKTVLIIEKENHIGGACYTEEKDGVIIHKCGPHIFHTSDKEIWDWVNQFDNFKTFINQPIAKHNNKIYNLPFNMNTFYQLYGVVTPDEAAAAIRRDSTDIFGSSFEDYCYRTFGRKLYLTLIKDYTEKQWGRKCSQLPQSLIERVPLRFEYNNNYYNDQYQGVSIHGYTKMIQKMLKGVPVMLNTSFKDLRTIYPDIWADKIIYTGAIDEFYDYCFGKLEYRSLIWDEKIMSQGCSVVNYTDDSTPYTRSIEHRLFCGDTSLPAYCSFERPVEWKKGLERYYPIPTPSNLALYQKYKDYTAEYNSNIIFCGRIGGYKYINMDAAIIQAIKLAKEISKSNF